MDDQQKILVKIFNQLFEIQKKTEGKPELTGIIRNLTRIHEYMGEMGLSFHNPLGEIYNETRTDCEADIVGELSDKMVISEVIKPIIYFGNESQRTIVQRGIVIVQSA
jgi:hypothetical protein